MQVKPSGWEFAPNGEYCCYEFKRNAINTADSTKWVRSMTTDGKDVFFEGNKIFYCPYCGTKIVLVREVE